MGFLLSLVPLSVPQCQVTNHWTAHTTTYVYVYRSNYKPFPLKILSDAYDAALSFNISKSVEIDLLCIFLIVCSEPKKLGMQNGLISDSQISASTEWHPSYGPSNSRLFYTPHNGRTGAWSSKTNDINQWLQVDFKQPTAIVGISTQGRANTQYVKSYTLSYSQDGLSFQAYKPHGVLKVYQN